MHRHMYGGNLDHTSTWWAGYLCVVALATILLMGLFLVMATRSYRSPTPTDESRGRDRAEPEPDIDAQPARAA